MLKPQFDGNLDVAKATHAAHLVSVNGDQIGGDVEGMSDDAQKLAISTLPRKSTFETIAHRLNT